MASESVFLNVIEIQERLPHRFPFLLIDRVLTFEHGPDPEKFVGRKAVARKNVSVNESFFQGHFPGNPVMPGVLQVEAMAQTGAIACVPNDDDKIDVLIAKINGAKFKRPVIPGDVLEIHASITKEKAGILTLQSQILCDGQLVAESEVMAKVFKK